MRLLPKYFTPLSGIFMAATVLSGLAFAQTGLTTIQDTLFKADGTRFSGTLTIQWSTFDAANMGTIVQQSKSVTVVNGNLLVQLVPNAGVAAPANVYTVHYQSDGSQQFTELWTVPASATSLTVATVRTGMITSGTGSSGGTGSGAANATPILESTVIGLVADLGQRPVKGPGFTTSSVAVINPTGQIETAVGDIGDCVFIDGTAGPCGGQQSQFFDAETPGGIVDGTNDTFTLANAPGGASLMLFRNGLYVKAGFDYNLTASTIQFVAGSIPQPADTLVASYRIDPVTSAGNIGNITGSQTPIHTTTIAQVLCSSNGQGNNTSILRSLGSCDLPADAVQPGDRIEIRFNVSHTGNETGFNFTVNWGSTTILTRQGSTQDSALAGEAQAAIGPQGSQISVQSWGSVLGLLPGIVTAPLMPGLKVDFQSGLLTTGNDVVRLSSFTVLRYPAN